VKRITFIATRKNLDPTERELYEMNLVLQVLRLDRAFADLGLLTVAACTPPTVEVRFVDEYVEPIDFDMQTDLVALSAKTSCVTRAYQVADAFRARGVPVIMGGIHPTLRPDEALEHCDCVVTGEAEAIWPGVVEDWLAGELKPRYDATEYPPMDAIPAPNWDAAPSAKYFFHQIQTTRGCPFTCRFCSVPDISGQSFRFKPVECVVNELRSLPPGGGIAGKKRPLYVVDDNFISRRTYTKDLLRALVPLHEAGEITPWSAETTLNVASDGELLDLFRDAGCNTLIIGLESIEEATLKEMAKGINFCMTFQDAIAEVHKRGMSVVGNFIVGFDTDTIDVFGRLRDFVQETGILYPFFSILNPMPGTKLFDDMEAEGRLLHQDWHLYDTRHVVMQPKQMSIDELQDGYVWLYEQLYGTELMLDRIKRNWEWSPRSRPLPEKLFIGSALGLSAARSGDPVMRKLTRGGLRLMRRMGRKSQPGQLLVMLDSTHYARFLHERYRSPDYARHAARYDRGAPAGETEAVAQWDTARAQRGSARSVG